MFHASVFMISPARSATEDFLALRPFKKAVLLPDSRMQSPSRHNTQKRRGIVCGRKRRIPESMPANTFERVFDGFNCQRPPLPGQQTFSQKSRPHEV